MRLGTAARHGDVKGTLQSCNTRYGQLPVYNGHQSGIAQELYARAQQTPLQGRFTLVNQSRVPRP